MRIRKYYFMQIFISTENENTFLHVHIHYLPFTVEHNIFCYTHTEIQLGWHTCY